MLEIVPVDFENCNKKHVADQLGCNCWGLVSFKDSLGVYITYKVFRLVNETSPTNAAISNDGKRFITLDNWHSVGYGNDMVVIYNEYGVSEYSYSLKEFLPDSIYTSFVYSVSSVSSIWWRDSFHISQSDTLRSNTLNIDLSKRGLSVESIKIIINLDNGEVSSDVIEK